MRNLLPIFIGIANLIVYQTSVLVTDKEVHLKSINWYIKFLYFDIATLFTSENDIMDQPPPQKKIIILNKKTPLKTIKKPLKP